MLVDTHCHITGNDYNDIPFLINKIKESGIEKIIVNGCDMESNLEVLELVKKYDIVYGAIGFHPTELDAFNMEYLEWLDDHLDDEKIVALGEIGLDYHYDNTDKEKQNDVFKKQLEIAKRHGKPVIVHSRDSIQDTYDMLSKYELRGSLHCYSGSLEMAEKFVDLGYMLGVGGVVTYKNAKNIVNVISNIGLEYILLETDSPYLTPEPHRKEKNDSSYVPIIANKIADIKNISASEVAKTTRENVKRLFDI